MRADQNWWRSLLFGSHLFLVLMNYTVKKKVEGKEAPYFEVWSIVLWFFSLYLSWFPFPLKLFCRQLKLIRWIFSRSQLSICNLLALRSIYENNKNFAIKEDLHGSQSVILTSLTFSAVEQRTAWVFLTILKGSPMNALEAIHDRSRLG